MMLEDKYNPVIWGKRSIIKVIDIAFPDNKFYYKEQYKVFMCELVRMVESKCHDLNLAVLVVNLALIKRYLKTLKKDGKSMFKKK